MKVSVITATIDSNEILASTLESVRSQTYPAIEHIVVDGLSTRPADIHEGPYYKHSPKGIYEALNFGISKATGDIVGIIHGGDRLASPEIVEKVVNAFKENPDLDFVYGDIQFFNPGSGRTGRIYHASNFTPKYLSYGMAPPHPSLYVRREAMDKIGKYREDFRLAGDLDMWMRLFADESLKSVYLPLTFAYMATGGASTSFKGRMFFNNLEKLKAMRLNGISANPFRLIAKYFIILRDMLFDPRKDR